MPQVQVIINFTDRLVLGRKASYTVDDSTTIHEIKQRVEQDYPQDVTPPDPARQIFIFKGRILENDKQLSDYVSLEDQQNPVTFHLVIRPAEKRDEAQLAPESSDLSGSATAPGDSEPAAGPSGPSSFTHASSSPNFGGSNLFNSASAANAASAAGAASAASTTSSEPAAGVQQMPSANVFNAQEIRSPYLPLHVLRLKVPTQHGEKTISIPCYEYMFVPTARPNEQAFCMAPGALMKFSALGVPVELPRMYSLGSGSHNGPHRRHDQPTPTANAANAAANGNQNVFANSMIARLRQRWAQRANLANRMDPARRIFITLVRIILVNKILLSAVDDPFAFWTLSCLISMALVYQEGLLELQNGVFANGNLATVRNYIRSITERLPHVHPNLGHQGDPEQRTAWEAVRTTVVMFLASLFPGIYEQWAQQARQRAELARVQNNNQNQRDQRDQQDRPVEQPVDQPERQPDHQLDQPAEQPAGQGRILGGDPERPAQQGRIVDPEQVD